jgi:fatty acid-binding protein DegV
MDICIVTDSTREYLPSADIPIVQITPILGAHLGVGALGFACISSKEN